MNHFEINVAVVMDFLVTEGFSPSVISSHRHHYQELEEFLNESGIEYSPDAAQQWLDMNQSHWSYRQYTSRHHSICQLEDVYRLGHINADHLAYRKPAYSLLNSDFRSELDTFLIELVSTDERYRIAVSRFLLYLQKHSVKSLQDLNYDLILSFHRDDYHTSSRSKDTYEDLIRVFLRYLADKNICPFGLSLALSKLLIHQIVHLSNDELAVSSGETYPAVSWKTITAFLQKMSDARYGKTVLKSTKHILTLLYMFLDMHHVALNSGLLWYWFEKVKSLLGTNWKQHRRSLCQFLDYLETGTVTTGFTGNPSAEDRMKQLPAWAKEPLNAYLMLLKREGRQPSTVAMQRSSNIRLCMYLQKRGITGWQLVTPEVLQDFNLQDSHSTPEGKAAYNCRIRGFLIYLYEQKYIEDPYLYRAIPTFVAPRTSLVQTLSKEEVEAIWSVDPSVLPPKALRDYAMLCIGLTMGFRASDIAALRFSNVDWKQKSISIVQQKTGKMLTMPMPVRTGNILFRYIRNGRPKSAEPYIFIRHEAPYDRIQRGVCRSALRRFTSRDRDSECRFHSVRRTFATQLLKGNTRVELISDSLGHSTDSTVHKYLSLDEERMRMCPLSLQDSGILYKGGAFYA
jgi:site-specific recombinase XerD